MRFLSIAVLLVALAGCTEAQLKKGEETAATTKAVATQGAAVAANPVVVAATGGTSTLIAEGLAALAALAWTTERFFAWRLKLKTKK